MGLAIRLLGSPMIEQDGVQRPTPRGHKPWALLGLVLLSEQPVAREQMAELLFPDADDPLASLRWNLAELRRSLGPDVRLGGDPLELELPADTEVDVRTLAAVDWEDAVRLPGLGRELLEGIQPAAHPTFEAWLLAERCHQAGLSAAVLREAAISRLATGDASTAIEMATRLVAIDEYDEEAYALLIRAHVASGNRAEAQRYLRSTIERFQHDLGIEPSATLLRAADPSAALEPATGRPTQAGIESLIAAGEAAIGAGAAEAGIDTLRRAVSDAEQAGERMLVAKGLIALGEAYIHGVRGRDGEGATALHSAMAIAEDIGSKELVSEATRELGYVEMLRGRYDRAESWLGRAVDEATDAGLRAAALGVSGAVAADRGQTAESIDLLTRALDETARSDKPRLAAWSNAFLGRAHLLRQEWAEARPALERSIAVSRSAGWMSYVPWPQAMLGTVDLAEGRVDAARDHFEAAFAVGCQIGDACWEGMGARGIGLVKILEGAVADGIAWLDDATTRCIRIPDTYLWIHGYCLDALCEQAIAHGDERAGRWVAQLEALAARRGMNELLVRAYLHRAALGDAGARESAAMFAARIDNPAVLRGVREASPVG
jgi:DNA-binding SARP family transcriptional activator